jgi:hypothetical protein
MYTGHIGQFGYSLGSTGLGDDGMGDLGFFFPGMEQLISKVMGPKEPPPEKKAPPMMTFCPPDMQPNPQWAAIPEDQKPQAAAAGVQACLPKAGPKGKPKCYFAIGARKFKCDQGDFQRAYGSAKRRAAKRPSGKATMHLQIGSKTIIIPVRAGAAPGTPGAPGAPGTVIPATQTPQGTFTCPPNLRIAQNAQGQVVCVDAATLQQQAAQQPPTSHEGGRRGRRHERRRGRGRRGFRDGLGNAYIHYPQGYQLLQWRQDQYAQSLAREPWARAQVVQPAWTAIVPPWMAQRLPPSGMTLADAFGAY